MFVISKLKDIKHSIQNYLFSMPQYFIERYTRIDVRNHLSEDNKKLIHLTSDEKRQIKNFYKPYGKILLGWHDMFKDLSGNFYPEYMPEDFYYTKIDTFYNNWQKGIQFDDKGYYDRLFSKSPFRLPIQICNKINGFWLDNNYSIITEEEAIRLIIDSGSAFLKMTVQTSEGHGVAFFDANVYPDEESKINSLKNTIQRLGKNIVVQKPIKQSAILSRINPSSVNTVRILSFLKKDGSVKIYSKFLRLGRNGSKVDNGFNGGIGCGINSDGSLKKYGFNSIGEKFSHHPDTNIPIDSITIPGYTDLLEKVKAFHPQFPDYRLISWDFAIDEDDQPLLIEFNIYCGSVLWNQIHDGPAFGKDTKEILDEVFKGKKNQ